MRFVDVKLLKKLMIDNNVESICDLAALTGVSRATLSKIIGGKALPSADTMEKIVKGLNLSPAEAGSIFFADKLA